jgi:prophage antirepressor-like protein
MTTPIVFEVQGTDIRFGTTDDGTPYSVAADFAKVMGYRQTKNALDLLDDEEKGFALTETPGGRQRLAVIYEDGMWELIFRSSLDGAKRIKKQVKEILRKIRETGRYEAAPESAFPVPRSLPEALRAYAAEVEAHEEIRQQVRELEPAARSWNTLASADGDFSVADAAKVLSRDPQIKTGRNRLFGILHELGWAYVQRADHRYRATQRAVERGWLSELPQSHYHPRTGELVLDPPQVRVTARGVAELHRRLGGTVVLEIGGAR